MYNYQSGGELPVVFRGPYQHGTGIGSFLGGLWRTVRPLFFSGAKALGKQALRSGAGVVSDLARGSDFRTAAKRRLAEAGDELTDKLGTKVQKMMSGHGRKRRRRRSKSKASPQVKNKKVLASKLLFSNKLAFKQSRPRRRRSRKGGSRQINRALTPKDIFG